MRHTELLYRDVGVVIHTKCCDVGVVIHTKCCDVGAVRHTEILVLCDILKCCTGDLGVVKHTEMLYR